MERGWEERWEWEEREWKKEVKSVFGECAITATDLRSACFCCNVIPSASVGLKRRFMLSYTLFLLPMRTASPSARAAGKIHDAVGIVSWVRICPGSRSNVCFGCFSNAFTINLRQTFQFLRFFYPPPSNEKAARKRYQNGNVRPFFENLKTLPSRTKFPLGHELWIVPTGVQQT